MSPPQVLDIFALADDAGHDWAAVDTDSQLQGCVVLQRVFAADMDHANGHAHHALGVIGTRLGQAADRHVGVADRLDLLYPELLRRRVKTSEQPIEQSHDILRLHVGRKLGEAYQVGKGDRDVDR